MVTTPARITTEVFQHSNGHPVAYTDATGVAVFTYQDPDGVYVIDVCTRDGTGEATCIVFDGVPATPQSGR